MGDIFGRRWFFIIGNFLSFLCGILGATAQNINQLIGGNLLGGLAGAAQISFTVAIAELVPNKHRPFWITGIFFSSFQFACFGPVIAQVLVANTGPGWRVNYYINIGVAGMAVLLLFLFCKNRLSISNWRTADRLVPRSSPYLCLAARGSFQGATTQATGWPRLHPLLRWPNPLHHGTQLGWRGMSSCRTGSSNDRMLIVFCRATRGSRRTSSQRLSSGSVP